MSGSTRAIVLTLSVKDAETVRAQLEQMGAAGETALKRLDAAAARTAGGGGALPQVTQEATKAGGAFGNMGHMVQQAGYQVGDFAVQVQGGTSALTALSQQGSQFLGMFGPAGAVAGVVLTIGTIAASFLTTKNNAAEAESAADKAFKTMQAGAEGTARSLREVNALFLTAGQRAAAAANAQGAQMRGQYQTRLSEIETGRGEAARRLAEQESFLRDIQQPGASTTFRADDNQSRDIEARAIVQIRELRSQITQADVEANNLRTSLTQLGRAQYGAEEFGPTSSDPNGTEALRASLDKRFAAQQAYAARVRDIQAQLRDGYIEGSEAERLSALATQERDSAIESLTKKTRGLTEAQKAENAEIAAMSQIIRDINRDYDKYQDDQMRARERDEDKRARDAEAVLKRQQAQAERSTDEVVRYGADMFADMFSTTEGGWDRMWQNMRRTATAIIARIAAEAVIRPVITPIVSSLFAGAGSNGVTNANGTITGGGFGGITDLLGLAGSANSASNLLGLGGIGSFFGAGGGASSLTSFGSLSGLMSMPVLSTGNFGAATNAALSGMTGFGPATPGAVSAAGATSTSLGSLLGGAGAGFAAGSLLNSLVGGKSLGGTVGSGAGALAGAAIGSIVPGVGTLIGGLIGGAGGGLLGGMFGANPARPASSVQIGIGPDGQLAIMGDRSKGMSSAEGLAAAQQTLAGINTAVTGRGLSLRASNGAVAQTHQGADARPEADRQEMTRVVLASLQSSSADVSAIIARELAKGTAASLDQAFADIDFAQQVYGPLTQAYRAAVPFGEVLAAIAAPFDAATAKARELGLAEDLLTQRRDEAVARTRAAAQEEFWSMTRSAEGRDYITSILGIRQNWAANGANYDAIAGTGSGDLLYNRQLQAQLDQLDAGQLQDVATNLRGVDDAAANLAEAMLNAAGATGRLTQEQQTAQQTAAGTITSLADYARSLQTGPNSTLNPRDQFSTAESRFNAISGAASAGDYRSLTQLQSAAEDYRNAAASVYSTAGGGYVNAVGRINNALSSVGGLSVDTLTGTTMAAIQQTATETLVAALQRLQDEVRSLRSERDLLSIMPARAA